MYWLLLIALQLLLPIDGWSAWQEDWAALQKAAKQEGKLVLIGPAGSDRRDSLVLPFQQKFGVSVEYLPDPAPLIPTRVATERQAGRYLLDVVIAGALEDILLPLKVLEPMEQFFVLPEITNPKNWRGGAIEYIDSDRTILIMTPFQRGVLFVNTQMAAAGQFKSYKDLLDAKWTGKIIIDDPRKPGPGQATFSFFYFHPELGADFIRALANQKLNIFKDYAQQVDFLGRGKYPLGVGLSDSLVEQRAKQGIPLAIVDPRQLREGADVSPASGGVGVFNRAPHPNAAKLYINWLLSKEGQTSFARGAGYISSRLDVTTDHAAPWRVPHPGAIKTYGIEARNNTRNKVTPLLYEVLGR
ncbi:MAG TPA: extracellular solute-binding protein [Candidatus Binatia bacterium]|jgi:iron(III) transport system substrate-binding protein